MSDPAKDNQWLDDQERIVALEALVAGWRLECVEKDEEIERLRAALVCAERKLSSYVGVCKWDMELTKSILPQCRSALTRKPEGQDNG